MYIQVFDEDSKQEDLISENTIDLTQVMRDGEADGGFLFSIDILFVTQWCIIQIGFHSYTEAKEPARFTSS